MTPPRAGTTSDIEPFDLQEASDVLTMTEEAAAVLRELAAPTANPTWLRIGQAPFSQNSHGPEMTVDLTDEPLDGDEVVEARGAQVFIDPDLREALDGKLLDAELVGGEIRVTLLERSP